MAKIWAWFESKFERNIIHKFVHGRYQVSSCFTTFCVTQFHIQSMYSCVTNSYFYLFDIIIDLEDKDVASEIRKKKCIFSNCMY